MLNKILGALTSYWISIAAGISSFAITSLAANSALVAISPLAEFYSSSSIVLQSIGIGILISAIIFTVALIILRWRLQDNKGLTIDSSKRIEAETISGGAIIQADKIGSIRIGEAKEESKPFLNIIKEPELREIELSEANNGSVVPPITWTYIVNRIIVKNNGKIAAKNCKGWIVTKSGKERICWTVLPSEKPNATINVKDEERLDFCAYYKDGPEEYTPVEGIPPKPVPKIIAPTEEGWSCPPKARPLDHLTECEVWVTSENAEPAKAKVKFGKNQITIKSINDQRN